MRKSAEAKIKKKRDRVGSPPWNFLTKKKKKVSLEDQNWLELLEGYMAHTMLTLGRQRTYKNIKNNALSSNFSEFDIFIYSKTYQRFRLKTIKL